MGRYHFELASEADDAELRQILAATPMQGTISLTFRREPSFFDAAWVDGTFCQIIVCRETNAQKIIGFGSRSVRERYVNGKSTPIGYLSTLRALPQHRNRGLLARGYKYIRNLHTDQRAELYLTTIAEGNERAISILTSARAGLPNYHAAGKFYTLVIPIVSQRPTQLGNTSTTVRPATQQDLSALVEFLHRVGPTRQFFPKYQASDFFNPQGTFRDLQPSDLLLAFRDGRIVGTLGGWDQSGFRQTVVERYSGLLRWTRWVYNGYAKLRGRPSLPKPGESFRYLTAALPCVENDDAEVFAALLDTLLARFAGGDRDYLLLGLHESDGLLRPVAKRGTVSYVTWLYHVCWEDGDELRSRLDDRPAYLELGCL